MPVETSLQNFFRRYNDISDSIWTSIIMKTCSAIITKLFCHFIILTIPGLQAVQGICAWLYDYSPNFCLGKPYYPLTPSPKVVFGLRKSGMERELKVINKKTGY